MADEPFHSLTEIVARARVNLSQGIWDYVVGAAETETTMKRNRLAIDRLGFRPRVLRDVSTVDLSSTFLGQPTRLPVFIAPVGQLGHLSADAAALASLSWADVERVRARCSIPLIVKGIATAQDARLAVEHGVDVVYVSNHGGRQLDHGRGSLDVLPEIIDEVGSEATVVVDGSFCRGTDILKAVALGADAVGLGRIACLGLAASGSAGLVRVLELIEDEMKRSAGMLGVTELSQLDASYVTDAPVVAEPAALTAFPLLSLH